ncbi:MAG: ABC transporter permease [Clostridia bacterium]|nr:ABC transporter permease [Clostridia bacterium]
MLKTLCELYKYREMLKNMVTKELRQRYKGSVLGFLWTFLNPLLMLVIYSIVFSTIMRIDIENYSMFLFVGLLPWMFFSTSVLISTGSIVNNGNLIKKIYFPREILPISVAITGLVNFLLSLIILVPALLFFKMEITVAIFTLPVIIVLQLIMVLGFTLFVSSLNVYFRDLEHILGVLMTAWFYVTPIIFPLQMVPTKFLWLVKLNPVAPLMFAYQDIFYYGVVPKWESLGNVFIFSVASLMIGMLTFGYLKRNFAEEL